jgi:hypothetical protein
MSKHSGRRLYDRDDRRFRDEEEERQRAKANKIKRRQLAEEDDDESPAEQIARFMERNRR